MSAICVSESQVTSLRREYLVDREGESLVLWWEFEADDYVPTLPATMDHLALATLPFAMTSGADLYIAGPVTRSMLGRLEDYQEAWSLIHPRFQRISLNAEEAVEEPGRVTEGDIPTSVVAYSGGLDANYTVIAHRDGLLRYRETDPVYAALVHGFDIPLESAKGFERAAGHARAMLEPEGVRLVRVRTNWRNVVDPGWTMTFAIAISAVLHQFSADVDQGLLGSGLPYHQQRLPWGTNPVTDPMLGRRGFPFVTVGLGSSRIEKARALATRSAVLDHLRVCWEGTAFGDNCGVCEKCIRTKLTFLAAGIGVIPALGPVTVDDVQTIEIRALAQRLELEELLDHGDELGPALTEAVSSVLDRYEDRQIP